MNEDCFDILTPENGISVPFLFNSPHSGRHYPGDFVASARLALGDLRKSEDCFVDELFGSAVNFGALVMRARYPRAFIDLNREPYELDPAMFDGPLPAYANISSLRVSSGLGTIAKIVAEHQPIYAGLLNVEEGLERIERYYKPYHQTLAALLSELRGRFGTAVLIDCHSMPSARIAGEHQPRPDFVIGDRFGTSCTEAISNAIHSLLTQMGYRVTRNKPYAGGFITERYGNPAAGMHAVQIEVNRALYMDEVRYSRSSGYAWLVADLNRLLRMLVALPLNEAGPHRVAAE